MSALDQSHGQRTSRPVPARRRHLFPEDHVAPSQPQPAGGPDLTRQAEERATVIIDLKEELAGLTPQPRWGQEEETEKDRDRNRPAERTAPPAVERNTHIGNTERRAAVLVGDLP